MTDKAPKKSKRGFAALTPEKRREIAAMGGKSVPAEKRSFSADPKLAAKAGKIGGKNVPYESRSFAKDLSLARTAGRKGGLASRAGSKD
jgi:uncharacterized protein